MDLAIVAFTNILVFYGYTKVTKSLNNDLKILKAIEKEPSRSPSEMKNYFESIRLAMSNNNQNVEISKMGFIEGKTACQFPIKSIINGKTQLIYSARYRYYPKDRKIPKKFETSWYNWNIFNEFYVSQPPKRFEIIDNNNKKERCTIYGNLNVNDRTALETIDFQIKYPNSTLIEKIVSVFYKTFNFFGVILENAQVVWVDYELGIKVGSPLCVFGKVLYNYKDKTLRIEHPLYFLLKDKSMIIEQLEAMVSFKRILRLGLFGLMLKLGIVMLKKAYKWYKSRNEPFSLRRAIRTHANKSMSHYRCMVCQEHLSELVFEPCNHICMCNSCFGNLKCVRCPECQNIIMNTKKIYIS